jgi:NAD(P)-dependent dehydrogenase (short-subunit alcohol dehydrogenase family)
MNGKKVIVFGASGSIGNAICHHFLKLGAQVIGVARKEFTHSYAPDVFHQVLLDRVEDLPNLITNKFDQKEIHAVVWAQGMNFNDDVVHFDINHHLEMYEANVTYIVQTLQLLLNHQLLAPQSRLCVISSIWQNIARQNKLSYCITKSALQGLVQSMSIDLGKDGILINAVLPGPLDTPMTRSNLSELQITSLEKATPLNSLPSLNDVTNLVAFLCSPQNTGITGQFIAADKGFSYARIIL